MLKDTGHCQNMSIADTGRFWEILVIPVLQILEDSGKYWLYQYYRYWKILENTGYTSIAESSSICNTGYTSIADTRTFWKILVIPVLQILEDSGKYIGHQHLRPHQPVYAYIHRPFPVPERYMRKKFTAASSSAWWYRRYRCGHHLRDRRKLFPPQSQISSRTSTTAESVGFGIVDTSTTPATGYLRMVNRRDAAILLPIIQ